MKSKIALKLKSIMRDDYIRFHMPGHKGNKLSNVDWFKYDFTEIPGSDNLSDPKGIIKETLDDIAEIYGSKKSLFLVNGSTVGILSAIMAVCNPGDSFIVPRNSHRSVFSALVLYGIDPKYIYPVINEEYGYGVSINPEDIDEILDMNPHCKGIIITSPTYYGTCCDLKEIVKIVRKHNKIIIVDEAHGPHFVFSEKYPMSAVEAGADIVIQSAHKVLNALTQTGLLHICTDNVDKEKISNTLSMLQTSSPSYPLMISIEEAVYNALGSGMAENIIGWHKYLEENLKGTGYKLMNNNLIGTSCIKDFDLMKIWFAHNGIGGNIIDKLLRQRYNIQVELSDSYTVLAMMGMGTRINDIEKLVKALKEIDQIPVKKQLIEMPLTYPAAIMGLSPWEARLAKKKLVLLEDSVGELCGDFLIPYPPGIPLAVPGEIITREIIDYIKSSNMNMIGIKELNKINIIY